LTRQQALARDPSATPIRGTLKVRDLPETDEERLSALAKQIGTHVGVRLLSERG